MKYRGIVFDKDGTLLDFNRTWLPIYRYAAKEFAEGDADLEDLLLTKHGYEPDRNRFVGGSLLFVSVVIFMRHQDPKFLEKPL